jgi:hypothetical protein
MQCTIQAICEESTYHARHKEWLQKVKYRNPGIHPNLLSATQPAIVLLRILRGPISFWRTESGRIEPLLMRIRCSGIFHIVLFMRFCEERRIGRSTPRKEIDHP